MENEELIKKIQELTNENDNLKHQNFELQQKVVQLKNWTGIKEGEIFPRLRKRYGDIGRFGTDTASAILQIIKFLLDIEKVYEINAKNYDIAKEIAVSLTDVICKYDCKFLERSFGKAN